MARLSSLAPPRAVCDFQYRPLYRQVRKPLIRRLAEATWPAGTMLPSEPALAAALGVGPGTARKALVALSAENLLVRRQGGGPMIAESIALPHPASALCLGAGLSRW